MPYAIADRGLACITLVALAAVGWAATPESQSGPAAKQLAAAMKTAGLDSIAARDQDAPGRFIAALVFPDSQLLLVAAPYPEPAALDLLIANRQYRDVYSALQQPSIKEGKVFFQDLGCDGLQPDGDGSVDVLYEQGTSQTMFDGHWKKHGLSENAYAKRFSDADGQYRRLLGVLLTAVQNASK